MSVDESYLAATGYKVGSLHVEKLLPQLTEKEKKYATYLTLATWAGFPIIAQQVSNESLLIHNFLTCFFETTPRDTLKAEAQISGSPISYLVEFAGQFYYSGGNFNGRGDVKMIPRISKADLFDLVKENAAATALLEKCADDMYSTAVTHLGFHPQGCTAYYQPADFTEDEVTAINTLLSEAKIGIENTTIEREDARYNVKIASVEIDTEGKQIGEHNGKPVVVTRGQYSEVCKKIVKWLALAKENAANETQDKMLEALIRHFITGNLEDHKEYSKYWVQDIDPHIEMHHGFIETYRDPSGTRAEFESFVACVDSQESVSLHAFVDAASTILSLMPYPKEYERSTFNPPSYNALNILTFCCSGMPIGINIPNYADITETIGFKNVTLSNVVNAQVGQMSKFQFLSDEDDILVRKNFTYIDNFGTAAHELYGHGSGKLFAKEDVEGKNIPDLLTEGKFVETYYPEGCNERTEFGGIYSAFEECRAEASALYLAFFDEALDIWQVEKSPETRTEFKRLSAILMLNSAIKGTIFYSPETQSWGQSHSQARFAILRACIIWGRGSVEVKKIEGDCPYRLIVHKDKLDGVKDAMTMLLKHLNYYRSTNQPAAAREFMTSLTSMDSYWLDVRAVAKKTTTGRGVIGGAVIKKTEDAYSLEPMSDAEEPSILDFVLGTINTIKYSLE